MSLGQATLWVALGSLLAGIVATVATIVYGEISRRQQDRHHKEQRALAEAQLRLASEQAEMRPRLEVACGVKRGKRGETGTLTIYVRNSGRVAAHNVHGWISFHKDFFGPPEQSPGALRGMSLSPAVTSRWGALFDEDEEPNGDGWYTASIFNKTELIVSSHRSFDISVTLKRAGKTPVLCRIVSNEGATFHDTLEAEVPEKS